MSFGESHYDFRNKAVAYRDLARDLGGLLTGERDSIANTANTAALLYGALPELNWCGFYFLKRSDLVLGPFQGRPACVRIAPGRGVCGLAASRRETLVVDNVGLFPDHIVCDAASQSEIVIPLVLGERLLGVLDVDSPRVARFDQEDREGLERIAALCIAASDWPATE